MNEVIKVGMAALAVCNADDAITTLGLGSCIGIAIRDPATGIGGLVHIMLPDSTEIRNNENRLKFADTGIEDLVKEVVKSQCPVVQESQVETNVQFLHLFPT